jgi:ferredoxin
MIGVAVLFGGIKLWPIVVGRDIPVLVLSEGFRQRCRSTLLFRRRQRNSPYVCEQGWCLACAARLKSGDVDRKDALTLYPEDIDAGFLLLCSTKPLSDLVLVQDGHATRREMTQQRIEHNQLARAYPPGARTRFRRGRAIKSQPG